MSREEEKRRLEKFHRVCNSCLRPKNLGQACIKFGCQYLRVTGIDNLMDSKRRQVIRKTPRPRGWRKKIFLKLRKTVFKELTRDKIAGRSSFYILGKAIGVATNTTYALQGIEKHPEDRKLFIEIFGDSPNGLLTRAKTRAKTGAAPTMKSGTPAEFEQFSEGLRDGARAVFNDDLSFSHSKTTTDIYITLLLFSEIVRYAPNIYALLDFFKERRGDDFNLKAESLEKMCRRVGIPLALKSTTKKTRPDKAIAVCPGNKI